jgi:hypothetical protein
MQSVRTTMSGTGTIRDPSKFIPTSALRGTEFHYNVDGSPYLIMEKNLCALT